MVRCPYNKLFIQHVIMVAILIASGAAIGQMFGATFGTPRSGSTTDRGARTASYQRTRRVICLDGQFADLPV
jgi:hypothetical protein